MGDLVLGGMMPTGQGGTVPEMAGNAVTYTLASKHGCQANCSCCGRKFNMLHFPKDTKHVKRMRTRTGGIQGHHAVHQEVCFSPTTEAWINQWETFR